MGLQKDSGGSCPTTFSFGVTDLFGVFRKQSCEWHCLAFSHRLIALVRGVTDNAP
jgi:hypothetical protein